MWGPILVIWEKTGIPVALLSQMIGSMIPGPDAPPWGPGLPPPRTFGTRLLARALNMPEPLLHSTGADIDEELEIVRIEYLADSERD